MAEFETPTDLVHNRELIADPAAFAKDADDAPFLHAEPLKQWVTQALSELSSS